MPPKPSDSKTRNKPRGNARRSDGADPRTTSNTDARTTPSRKLKEVNIAVMGPTGTGKTTFINLASRSELRVGTGLESATERIWLSSPVEIDKYRVTLIDTPGFDDTNKSDVEVLKVISNYLSHMSRAKQKLSGVIYLHRITDNRMGGTALRNFKMFMAMCGKETLPNAAIVLNMWNEVAEEVGKAREQELLSKDIFFRPAIQAGARIFHHENKLETAYEILRWVSSRRPKPLRIQKQVVQQGRDLRATDAGLVLLGELAEKERKHQEQMQRLQKEAEEARRRQEFQDETEIEEERRRLAETLRQLRQERDRINTSRSTIGPPLPSGPARKLLFSICLRPNMAD